MKPLSPRFFLPAAFAAAFAASGAAAQTLSVSVDPAQDRYYAGQRVSCILQLDLGGAELAGGGNLSLSGIPDSGPAFSFGSFAPAAPGPAGEQRWIAPLRFVSPTNFVLAPAVSGTLRRETSRRGSFFRAYSLAPFDASARPLALSVAATPSAGRPADDCGAVGPIGAEAALAPLDCAVGDLLTLRWTLRGPGADAAEPAAWSPGPGFKAYPPRVEERADGRLSVSQVVVPLDASATNAAAFSVSWFDPRSGWTRGGAGPFAISFHERKREAPAEDAAPAPPGEPPAAGDAASGAAPGAGPRDFRVGAAAALLESAPARFAPGPRAKILFDVPQGTPVRVVETLGAWVRVAVPDGAAGWLPASLLR